MAARRNPQPSPLALSHVTDGKGGVSPEAVHRNFQAIKDLVDGATPALRGKVTETLALVSGNNTVHCPVKNPTGRHTVFVDANVTIYDVGPAGGDTWTVNCSGPCNARFLFF